MTIKRNRLQKHFSNLLGSAAVMIAITLSFCLQNCVADEISINADSAETIVGDFRCKPCDRPILNSAHCIEMSGTSLTTGDLYRYFESRGIKNIDRLSLQVDVNCSDEEDLEFQLNGLNFKITDSEDQVLTDVSLKENSLSVPGSDISSYKPEAVLEFDLGYNFMERFSSESTDSIVLDFDLPTSEAAMSMSPRFVVSEDISSFTVSNLGLLVLFVSFWVAVFLLMNIFSRRAIEKDSPTPPKAGNLVQF